MCTVSYIGDQWRDQFPNNRPSWVKPYIDPGY